MIPKAFDAVTKEDIEALITDAVSEGRSIEYKEALPGQRLEDKREFLADVSSFANASGGDIIYGIREKRDASGRATGIPEAADGLAGVSNADSEKLRLQSLMRTGIAERIIPEVGVRHLAGFSNGPVILLRVPKSLTSPHMVTLENLSRFFYRVGTQKQQMDVREIRTAFIASESLSEKISAFRSERVGKVIADETPIPMTPRPKFILHLLPLQSFSGSGNVDLKAVRDSGNDLLKPIGEVRAYGQLEFNFNGLLLRGHTGQLEDISYVQLYRNGAIESVSARGHLLAETLPTKCNDKKWLFGNWFEAAILEAIPRYLEVQETQGFGPPVFVAISLIGARGYMIGFRLRDTPKRRSPGLEFCGRAIDMNAMLVPEVLIPERNSDVVKLLRPALDTIWQSAGAEQSLGYDKEGNRNMLEE